MPEDYELPMAESPQEDIFFRNEMIKITKEIIEDKTVEEKLKDFPLWAAASKSLKLTFLTPRDVTVLNNLFEAETCKMLRSIPPCVHDSDLYMRLGQARMIFMLNANRSLGTPNRNIINERIAQLSQIKQVITTGTGESGGSSKGFFKRLMGLH